MLDLTVPAVIAYAQPRPTRDAGGMKHAVMRYGDAKALCGESVVSYGDPVPPARPHGMCERCVDRIYGPRAALVEESRDGTRSR
jgi:hypothetical protein